ncbi:MAG: hypothetical protein WC307_03960 [Candidatus Nanoarchaeia archaeon]|jgi:hypothetical protein
MARRGVLGFNELVIAILAGLILILIALVLFNIIDPLGSSAGSFGEQAAEVFN